MRIGLTVPVPGESPELAGLLDSIQRVDALGLDSAWMPNIRGYDALTVLALAGPRTTRVELGSFVVPTYPRHPSALAQQALTAQVASGGRLVLGIGLSHRAVIESLGLDYSHPARHMREYLRCLSPLLRQEATTCRGDEFTISGYQLSVPGATPPPVLVAALGPRMLRLAGSLADGTAIWMGGPRYIEEYVQPVLGPAAREAGRPAPRVLASVPVCVTDQAEAVRQAAARIFARYGQLPSYRAVLDKEGVDGPADVALIGDEATVRRGLDAFAAAGATDFSAGIFAPRGENPERSLNLLRDYAAR